MKVHLVNTTICIFSRSKLIPAPVPTITFFEHGCTNMPGVLAPFTWQEDRNVTKFSSTIYRLFQIAIHKLLSNENARYRNKWHSSNPQTTQEYSYTIEKSETHKLNSFILWNTSIIYNKHSCEDCWTSKEHTVYFSLVSNMAKKQSNHRNWDVPHRMLNMHLCK